jgi:hypothetical protein
MCECVPTKLLFSFHFHNGKGTSLSRSSMIDNLHTKLSGFQLLMKCIPACFSHIEGSIINAILFFDCFGVIEFSAFWDKKTTLVT